VGAMGSATVTGATMSVVSRSIAIAVAALALVAAGCGGGSSSALQTARATSAVSPRSTCPVAWRAGWQRLADRIDAPVYCPTWMPNPLDAHIGGEWQDIYSIDKDRSYLISFLAHDQSGDVHVNFRGYPGRTTIPTCKTVDVEGTQVRRGTIPCFTGRHGTRRVAGIVAAVYTVNQDADQWHVLYAWRRFDSLYTVSEHVIQPYTYAQVVRNLDRLLRALVVVRPHG